MCLADAELFKLVCQPMSVNFGHGYQSDSASMSLQIFQTTFRDNSRIARDKNGSISYGDEAVRFFPNSDKRKR